MIVLTTFDADEHVLQALRAGAAGFLLKDTPPSEIAAAVRRVVAGDAQLSPSVIRQLIGNVTRPGTAHRHRAHSWPISPSGELAVSHAIGEGLPNAEIARRLHLGVPTVKTHVTAIFGKLGVTNRVQVALVVHDAKAT